jgi:hypothetical protein
MNKTTTITPCWRSGYEAGKAGVEISAAVWTQQCTDYREGYSSGRITGGRLSESEMMDSDLADLRSNKVSLIVRLTDTQLAEIEAERWGE